MFRPTPFGKYLLLERLSVGGMAEVFKARAFGVSGFSRFVAIKKILPHLAEDQRFVEMFIAEAKMAVQLNHTAIAQIIELGRQEGDDHFIAMEYVPGKDLLSLHHHFRKTRSMLPVHLVATIGARVGEGLNYAHRKRGQDGQPMGIVHRDISPQNVMISWDGAVKLIDFGIAKARVRSYQATQAGVLKGKFGYMSPEQIEGKAELDHRSDIFGLGTVLHELLTRKRLFHGDNDFMTLEMVREAQVSPPSSLNPEVPAELDAIILRALARDREDRYQSAGELAEDLTRFLHSVGQTLSGKGLGDWMVREFGREVAEETRRDERYLSLEIGPTGEVLERQEEEEEATALWDPIFDDEGRLAWEEEDPFAPLEEVPTPATNRSIQDAPTGQRATVFSAAATAPGLVARERPSRRREVIGAGVLLLGAVGAALVVNALLLAPDDRRAGIVLRIDPAEALTIKLDGRVMARSSPLVLRDLDPGEYTLEVEASGYTTWTGMLRLSGGIEERRVKLEALPEARAKVRFEVEPPGATVRVNGRQIEAAAGYVELPVGEGSALEIRAKGYRPMLATLRPRAGTQQTLRYALEPEVGTIFVRSEPPAEVFLNGKRVGRTPTAARELDVRKAYTVRVSLAGHEPFEQLVSFGEKRAVELDAQLRKSRTPR